MMCENTNQDQASLQEQQQLNTELSELREWAEQRQKKQMILHDQMVVYYDRMLTKCNVYEEVLERTREENARFKLTSQCLMDKIKEMTTSGVDKSSMNPGNDDGDGSPDKDITDPIATYLEVCSKKLIDEVGRNREHFEMATIELEDTINQLAKSMKTQSCLRRCVNELTVLAETERMKRDREELELRTTVDRLTAELVEVQQEIGRLQSIEAEIAVKLMHRESAQDELDEKVRADNARLQAELGKSAIVEAELHLKIYDLEKELSKRTEAAPYQQEQCRAGVGSESMDKSTTSLILYQCDLSQSIDNQVAGFPNLGHGDDQSTQCLFSSTNNYVVVENVQPPCSTSTAVQASAETAFEPSPEELRNRRLAELIKQYESKHDDDF